MTEFPSDFSPPVSQLLTLGAKNIRGTGPWLDYLEMGLTSEHIPELVTILKEIDLFWPENDIESPQVYTPNHAWRALGQLKAQEAIPVLIELVDHNETLDSDWIMEEIPEVMGMIGPAAIPTLGAYLLHPKRKTWASITTASCLSAIGKQHPDDRTDCIDALSAGLQEFEKNDETANGFLINALAKLNARESASLVERAYQAGRVDEMILGDYEDFQIAVGLLGERATPPPRYDFFEDPEAAWQADKKHRQADNRRQQQQAQKDKKKRKQSKKTRRGKRGKRK